MASETEKHINPDMGFLKQNQSGLLKIKPEELGRLKREIFWMIGENRSRAFFTRWGYSCGQGEALEMSATVDKAIGQFESYSKNGEELGFETVCSPEAEAAFWLGETTFKTNQCDFLAGYLTGFMSARAGEPIIFVETKCRSNHNPSCEFLGKKLSAASDELRESEALYAEDNLEAELNDALFQLKQTKDRYQNLFEYSNVPIFIVDPESGGFLNMNIAATELTGYSKVELLGMNVFDLCPPEFHPLIVELMKKLVAEGKAEDKEASITKKDGSLIHVSQSSKVLSYGGRQVIQAALRDITDLKISELKEKELQDQLSKSERLSSIGRLAANVAHELKNPLGAIRNALYYIKTSLQESPLVEADPHLKEILNLAEGEVDTSVTIIGELLDFSRAVHLAPRKTQINEIVLNLPNILRYPDNVKAEMDLDQNLPIAIVDPDRLKQVFCNLANNGIQAMPHGGTLKITTSLEVDASSKDGRETRLIHVGFEDTGVGIDPAHLTKIFEPLFTTKAQGTGLGLAICNNIIEKHGGTISVVSQKGKGSRFTVKIPLEALNP